MKRNSSILFHSMGKSLKFRYLLSTISMAIVIATLSLLPTSSIAGAAESGSPVPYQAYFDPAQGFKPAQPNFAKIFLQMAGSLEYYGSPEPYLRHVMAEQTRIDAIYQKATGRTNSSRPAYFTGAYLENLIVSWNNLSSALKLDKLCHLAGRDMRYAILGGWNKTNPELVEQEVSLSESEKSAYRNLLTKEYFITADFANIDSFYKTTYNKLTDEGKNQISSRTRIGQLSPDKCTEAIAQRKGGTMVIDVFNDHQEKTAAYYESVKAGKVNSDDLKAALITCLKLGQTGSDWNSRPVFERDALQYSHEIQTGFDIRFEQVSKRAKTPEQAENIKRAMISMVENLVVTAHSEYLAALRAQIAP